MYLQVTTLAEIATHDGTQILPNALQQGHITPSLQMMSTSLLLWPHQPNPCKKAWLLWNQMIKTIYVKPGMTTLLIQPLGHWCPRQTPTCQWHIIYNPWQQVIFTQYPNQPCQIYFLTHETQSHQYYSQGQDLNLLPLTSYPVTIDHQKVGFWIVQPIPTYKSQPLSHPPTPSPVLEQHIKSILPNIREQQTVSLNIEVNFF